MEKPDAPNPTRRHKVSLVLSAVLCLIVGTCYWVQPDRLAAATLVPAWLWLLPGLVLIWAGSHPSNRRGTVAVLTLWLAFLATLVPEARSLTRFSQRPTAAWQTAAPQGRTLRVVSLNCAGSAKAAAEITRCQPDIVLLQESPKRETCEQLAHELFGEEAAWLCSSDTSILVRGRIEPQNQHQNAHYTHAKATLSGDHDIDIVCLRLSPPVFRLDFWTLGFWAEHRDKRVTHRKQIDEVMQIVKSLPDTSHVIVGGDFNAPAGDGSLTSLCPRLVDTFRQAGRGWGNTGTNGAPLFRVDQIWASRMLNAETVIAQKTTHSDHRMVVCDLIVDSPPNSISGGSP